MKFLGKYRSAKEMFEKEPAKELEKVFKHGRPISRRDFLAAGALQFSATMTLPSLLHVLSNAQVAEAQELCKPGATGLSALVTLNLAGGAAMSGNFVPHDKDRQMLKSYSKLGLGSTANLANRLSREFGNVPFYDQSQMLAGIRATASVDTLSRTAFVAIPCQSQDDSRDNKFDITGLATKAGLVGSILPNLGRESTATGIRQQPALVTPPTPLAVGSVDDISNALGVAGSLASLTNPQKSKLFSLISRLSDSQARNIASLSGGKALGDLVRSATNDNISLASSEDNGTDPLNDSTISDVFDTIWTDANGNGIIGANARTQNRVFATMVYNSLKNNAGSANLQMGGYDYHGNGRAQQDQRDLQAGRVMGQVLESAAAMNQPLFFVVTSDGAVGSPDSAQPGTAFTGDRGRGGSMYVMAYHPVARPNVTDFQVGHFKPGANEQAADDKSLTGGSPELAAAAAFANYLGFNGQLGLFEKAASRVWTKDELDSVTKIRNG